MNKILILSNNISGLYRFRREVIEAFIQRGDKITICTPSADLKDYFINIGCTFIPTDFKRKGKNPFEQLSLIHQYFKIIKQIKPDLILTYTIRPNILGGIASRLCRVPLIANVTGLGTSVETSWLKQNIMICLLKLGLRKANTIFFQNEDNLSFFKEHDITKGKKILIPGSGVNLNFHSFQSYPPAPPLRFVFISRLRKEKGIEHYLESAKILKNKYHDVEFHVIGPSEDNYLSILKEYQDNGFIEYHGWVADTRPLLGNMHCTVHPSYYPEGMSNVLLESCAAGRPIITTDKCGCREVVDNGKNGFIVKQKDTDDLVEKIEKFIHLSYEQQKDMGLAARIKVEKEFDRNIVISAYLKASDSL